MYKEIIDRASELAFSLSEWGALDQILANFYEVSEESVSVVVDELGMKYIAIVCSQGEAICARLIFHFK